MKLMLQKGLFLFVWFNVYQQNQHNNGCANVSYQVDTDSSGEDGQ
jgi:hypothetical protein